MSKAGARARAETALVECARNLRRLKIGEVLVDATTDPAPPVMEIEARLRKEAARIGGDAVVVVYDRIQPVGALAAPGSIASSRVVPIESACGT